MDEEFVRLELNAIRLIGRWSVPGSKSYTFQWTRTDGHYDSTDSLNQYPEGTVKDDTGRRKGSWTTKDDLDIVWNYGGETASWTMPLTPRSQSIEGVSGTARRLSHPFFGKVQT